MPPILPLDMSGALSALATGSYSVKRRPKAVINAQGVATPQAETTFSITASVQPLKGSDLQRLPEGLQTSEVLNVFTTEELHTEGSTYAADVVVIDGADWEVQTVRNWAASGGFCEALVAKVEA